MAEVGGIRAHVARLRRIAGPTLRERVGDAVMDAARAIETEARTLAGDGSLAAGIVTERTGPLSAEVLSTAPHAAVVEFGTSKRPARPYLRPAAARQRGVASAGIARAIRSVVRGES